MISTIRTGLGTDGDKHRVVYAPNRTCLHGTGQTGWQTSDKIIIWIISIMVSTKLVQLTIVNTRISLNDLTFG